MRYLNKIVFINSAHIRYAEINLNGNVHLIGTQGVGKSTILRALLFFYNADKQKLGIPKEKKNFDDFYFEQANSYVIYEIVRDENAFTIVLFKSQGRACYRFIDAPYNRSWFVDDAGDVSADFSVIRSRLNGTYMSSIIDRYEVFRDIIYGNHQNNIKKEFYKFSISESPRYQNIPRSIQNVFLNSKLDANFIKDTIIRSMDEEGSTIDLNYFRNQVSEFEDEYKDINLWFEKNKRGEIDTQKDAEKTIGLFHKVLQLKKEIENSCQELLYAYRDSKEKLPSVEIEIGKLQNLIEKINETLKEEQNHYDKECGSRNRDLGIVSGKLKETREKTAYYESQNIFEILKKQEQEPILETQKESLEEKKRLLTRQFEDVTEKYKQLEEDLLRSLEGFKQKQQSRINQKEREKIEAEQKAFAQKEKSNEEIRNRYADKEEFSRNNLNALRLEESEKKGELSKLEYKRIFEQEIDSRKNQIYSLSLKEKDLQVAQAKKKIEVQKLTSARDADCAYNEAEFQKQNDQLKQERQILLQKQAVLEELLSKQKNSLYEWLQNNKPGWLDNIGKVVAEDALLYQSGLNPSLFPNENSLFGVNLNLENLPIRVRTPEELKNEKDFLENSLEQNKKKSADLAAELVTKNAAVERSYSPKIKNAQDEIRNIESELAMIPVQRKRLENELKSWEQKEVEEKENRKKILQNALADLAVKKLQAEETFEKLKAAKDRELHQIEKDFKEKREKALHDFDVFQKQIQDEIKHQEEVSETDRQQLRKNRDDELKNKNVDVTALNDCEADLSRIQKELDNIKHHRELVFRYRKDKEELFDREGEFKQQKKDLEYKIQNLKEKFSARRQKLEAQRFEHSKNLSQQNNLRKQMIEGIDAVDKFALSSICPENWKDLGETATAKSCQEILESLRQGIGDQQKRQKDLEISINKFKSCFSRRNTFKFKMELNTEDDYLSFAENLDDFILNKKFEEYRNRTSGRYTDILARLSKEVGNVTKQKSAVEKIINDVNRDFREKNFAGVIKSIELRTQEANDPLMKLLLQIQEFHAENQYSMGELNLFSNENSDDINRKAIDFLMRFVKQLNDDSSRAALLLSDSFQLQFRIVENDNDTKWIDKIANVGSDGTDILVKAMVNIMLINVFKREASRKFGDFKLHCMMDEIGKLHPNNVSGILKFANSRNIYLINGSPTTQSVSDYRYTYLLEKNSKSQTIVHPLITHKTI